MRFGIVLILFLLSSCAQVGVLTGGSKDEIAPKPNLEKMVPKNATTSFNGKELMIPFDEYIKLKNPSETIVVVPPNIKPKATIKKKTLIISWEEDLLPNTTYAFYLNGTVQDTKESNDSLMTFVFSSGTYIDSLTAEFSVRNAFTNEPQKGLIVGLYENYSDSLRPTFFTLTDAQGIAKLTHLKAGTYDLVAFLDKNKDLKHQADEVFGFKNNPISLVGNLIDTIPIRTYIPEKSPEITGLKFNSPGSFILSANRPLENARLKINGLEISNNNWIYFTPDSLLFPYEVSDSSLYTAIVVAENWTDTNSIRITQREKKKPVSLKFEKENEILPKVPFALISSAEIVHLNPELILIQNAIDSTNLIVSNMSFLGNRIVMNFDRGDVRSVNLIFLPGAIVGKQNKNADTIGLKATCLTSKDIGNLDIDLAAFTEPLILEILRGKQLIHSIPIKKSIRNQRFENLKPGDYSLRIIYDENENGRWDVGNRKLKIQPEFVEKFEETQKVRGNWDVEVVLKKAINGDK
jgi:uncharacterized protein (DUF2141 family)